MPMTSESSAWLTAMLSSRAPGGKLLAHRAAAAICAVVVVVLAGCRAAPQPESRQPSPAGTTVQAVKSSQSNVTPSADHCGLTAYPASRSTQEILADAPQKGVRSQDSTMFAKVAIDPEGRITHLRVLRLAYPEASTALRNTINAQAVDAIKQWHYAPTIIAGKPVTVCSDLTVTIDLH